MLNFYECEGQMSIFDLLAPQTEKKYKPGELVERSELGKEISFDEIVDMIGQLIILDKSTVSHEWFKVVQVEQIVMNGDQRRLVYYDGGRQRGLINEMYFNLEDKANGFAKHRQHAYKLKEDDKESQSLPCDNCIFSVHSCCEYNTRECYCVNGDKQITLDSGWVLINNGRNLPPYTTTWTDYDVKVYYEKIDKYEYEVWEYKDYTWRSHEKYDCKKGMPEVVAWRKK